MKCIYYISFFLIFVTNIHVFAQDQNDYGVSFPVNYTFININDLESITPIKYQSKVSPGFKAFYIYNFNDLISTNIEFGIFREVVSEKTMVETIESTYVEDNYIIEVRKKSALTENANIDALEFLASVYYQLGYFSKRLETISLETGISYSKPFDIKYGSYDTPAVDNDMLLKDTIKEDMVFVNIGIKFDAHIVTNHITGVYMRYFFPLRKNISSTVRHIGQFNSGRISKIRIGFFISID